MKENKYDDNEFFQQYKSMPRSQQGLEAAGEWHQLKALFPDVRGKAVLDLGCGFGWHCRYAQEQGATQVVGVDISQKMLTEAAKFNTSDKISYIQSAIEDIDFPEKSFDVIISSLAFHYVQDFAALCHKVFGLLKPNGVFLFSVENPIFTANEKQYWQLNEQGEIAHWPLDNYFHEGLINTEFLGCMVKKYHRTYTNYISSLLNAGFQLKALVEPTPSQQMLDTIDGMQDELRRPMMLILSASKA
ncbi:class I SAM-dependent methyltransferase [Vibrio hibernica]|uniref:class I SAM-dependent methyltransferase n=1 Tax=Vibrio hibernica TaxID=2587465 RepID=UPI001882283E|nr:class I SAM-dependent methyltransferase [Vibrio hibernica]